MFAAVRRQSLSRTLNQHAHWAEHCCHANFTLSMKYTTRSSTAAAAAAATNTQHRLNKCCMKYTTCASTAAARAATTGNHTRIHINSQRRADQHAGIAQESTLRTHRCCSAKRPGRPRAGQESLSTINEQILDHFVTKPKHSSNPRDCNENYHKLQ